jgi:hypothetical protein
MDFEAHFRARFGAIGNEAAVKAEGLSIDETQG